MRTRLIETDQDLVNFKLVLDTPAGRAVIAALLAVTGIRQSAFTSDPYLHAFRSGIREVGLQIEDAALKANPILYALLQKDGE